MILLLVIQAMQKLNTVEEDEGEEGMVNLPM